MISGENIDFEEFAQEEIEAADKNLRDLLDRHVMKDYLNMLLDLRQVCVTNMNDIYYISKQNNEPAKMRKCLFI